MMAGYKFYMIGIKAILAKVLIWIHLIAIGTSAALSYGLYA